MARYSGTWTSVTNIATADTTNLVDASYPFLLAGGASTMQLKVNEIYIGGESPTTSTPVTMQFARNSTAHTGGVTVGTTAALDGTTTAPGTLAVFGNTVATTKPQRSSTLKLLGLSLNTYGGIARWQARYGEEITLYGLAATAGECSLSSITGAGITSGHVLYEVV
jgi:hypothetical protein